MVEVLCSLVNLVMESRYWPDDWRRILLLEAELLEAELYCATL